jgi:glucan 1,3-beta-glucosidase
MQEDGKAMVATNLGGWLVLEPWITPSLFYRFLDMRPGVDGGPAMDSYSLCESLGPVEGNKLMRAHFDSWITEDHIASLASRKVEMLRLPIGDWTLEPYGPYVGCMRGAKEKVDWLYDTCAKYGIKVLLDVHAMKGSQNGFDNSGMTNHVKWSDDQHFSHWPDSVGEWQGEWDSDAQQYSYLSHDNMNWSLKQAEGFLKRWGQHTAFYAYEPVNEPWWNSDMDSLFQFYRDTRALVQQYAPQAIFCFHDAFTYDSGLWNTLFADDDMDKVVLDHHYYQAWNQGMYTTDEFCDDYENNAAYADTFKYPVWFGEWALATDVCAHWLGGFNDGNTDPQMQCEWVDCPVTYLPEDVAVDFNRTAYIIGPFGTGNPNNYCIQNGKCSKDSTFFSDDDVNTLAKCAYKSFDQHLDAHIMWTAHNEIEEKWDYIRAYDKGWLQA